MEDGVGGWRSGARRGRWFEVCRRSEAEEEDWGFGGHDHPTHHPDFPDSRPPAGVPNALGATCTCPAGLSIFGASGLPLGLLRRFNAIHLAFRHD